MGAKKWISSNKKNRKAQKQYLREARTLLDNGNLEGAVRFILDAIDGDSLKAADKSNKK